MGLQWYQAELADEAEEQEETREERLVRMGLKAGLPKDFMKGGGVLINPKDKRRVESEKVRPGSFSFRKDEEGEE